MKTMLQMMMQLHAADDVDGMHVLLDQRRRNGKEQRERERKREREGEGEREGERERKRERVGGEQVSPIQVMSGYC